MLQGGVIEVFLQYIWIENARAEQKKMTMKRRRQGKKGQECKKEGQVSISLYLPGKNVERTKQMNRREEGMITTKMIIFNQNHDNNKQNIN